MKKVTLPWGAWYVNTTLDLHLPDEWEVTEFNGPAGAPDIDALVVEALAHPLGTGTLRELARGKRNVMIAIDDTTRPTPSRNILNGVLQELNLAGVNPENIQVIVAAGCHRLPTRRDMVLKLGEELLNSIHLLYHNPYEPVTFIGKTSRGTPVYTNAYFQKADLKIGIGSISPHELAGFGGGGKIVAVGLAGIETLYQHHIVESTHFNFRVGDLEENDAQTDLREITDIAGLDFVINSVPGTHLSSVKILSGSYVEVHDKGVAIARSLWEVNCKKDEYDILILNAYPKDIDLVQSQQTFNCCFYPNVEILKSGGMAVATTPAPDGAALHLLGGLGMRGFMVPEPETLKGRHMAVFSPCLNHFDIQDYFPAGTRYYPTIQVMLDHLKQEYPGPRNVAVFHAASLQWINKHTL